VAWDLQNAARMAFDDLRSDLKSGVRQLTGAPGFSLLAIATLTLGIGANAAIFGVVKSVLLDVLPYADAGRLVRVWGGVRTAPQIGPVSAGAVAELADRQRSFVDMTAFDYQPSQMVLGDPGAPRAVPVSWVEPRFFEVLGVPIAVGRTFRTADAGNGLAPLSGGQLAPDNAAAVVITDSAWQRLFGRDPAIVGRSVRLNGIQRTVVGVLPPGFAAPMGTADFYLPLDLAPVAADPIVARRSGWLGLIGRLRPGVTVDSARQDVAAIWADFADRYPDDSRSLGIDTVPLRDAMVGDTRTPLLVLIASAGFVLLIACANLASALLSRALHRRKEFAVRAALGAGRGRVVRQLLTESMLLSVCGGIAGLVLAMGGLRLLRTSTSVALPDYANLTLDGGAVAVTAVVAIMTGLFFGLVPALSAGGRGTGTALREDARGSSEGRRARQLRGLLMAGQVALCISLLVGAGLLARSLQAMMTAPLGIQTDGVLTATIQLPGSAYAAPASRVRFQADLLDRLRVIPGDTTAATTSALPTTTIGQVGLTIDGVPTPASGQPFVLASAVSDEYFSALQVPVVLGRTFDSRDRDDGPRVAVISRSMARRYWPRGDALGARMRLGPDPNAQWVEVIGIVGDVRNDPTRADAAPIVYGLSRQNQPPFIRLVLRTEGDPMALAPLVERTLTDIDPELPLQRPAALDEVVGDRLAPRRLPALLMVSFGILALVLASVGVYAMFANMAAAREREFGIRLALGSRPAQVGALLVRQGGGWMLAGLLGGIVGTTAVVRFVRQLLYGVEPFDPITLVGVLLLLVASAALAVAVPLRRAARVDPALALRA
jgi:predicted permease